MKKATFFLFLLLSQVAYAQLTLPVDFESTTITYTLTDFGGNASSVVVDPTNAANKVVRVIKGNGAEIWAGTTIGGNGGFAAPFAFTAASSTMSLRVWSAAAGTPIRLKAEVAGDGTKSVETQVNTTKAGDWEMITFDFSKHVDGTAPINYAFAYNMVSVFFNFGAGGPAYTEQTFYFDDLHAGMAPPPPAGLLLPLTFEQGDFDFSTVMGGFDGGVPSVIDNPSKTGLNTSAKVLKVVKNAGQPWGGVVLTLGAPVDLNVSTQFTMNVWSPRADAKLLFKIENATNGAQALEVNKTIGVANQWTEMTFDMSAANKAFQYGKVVFIYDLGTMGDGTDNFTVYVDDVKYKADAPPPPPGLAFPLSFDQTDIDWTTRFTDFDGGTSAVIDNPVKSGINTSPKVARMIKNAGQPWGGTTILMGQAVDLTEGDQFKVKVWSPRADAKLLFKLENEANGAENFEVNQTIGVANEWTEMTFDMSGANKAFQMRKVVLIFDLGSMGDGSNNFTFYYDDIMPQGSGEPGLKQIDLPVTFDATDVDYTVTDFGGNASELVTDPDNAGNKVMQVTKTGAAELWAGTTIGTNSGFRRPIPFTAGNRTLSVRVRVPNRGVVVRLKVENATDGTKSVETEAVTTVVGQWETLTFDFNNQANGTAAFDPAAVYQKASIFFAFGKTGAENGARVYHFDDVKMGTIGPVVNQIDLPVTFDRLDTDYTMSDFGGNASEIVADPAGGDNKVLKITKSNAAELWAGTTLGTSTGFKNAIPFTKASRKMTARVWSPDAGIQVRLKVELTTDGSKSVETFTRTTVANAWEVLTFDFNVQASGTPAFDPTIAYNKASIFMNFGVTGADAGVKVYYVDDVRYHPFMPSMPMTFEEDTDWSMLVQNFDGGSMTVIDNPSKSGINTSNKVARMVKNAGAVWAGAYMTMEKDLDMSKPVFKVKVWSPRADAKMLFKIEHANEGTKAFEVINEVGAANQWKEVTFDLSGANMANTYRKVVIIFDLGVVGDGSDNFTFYMDDFVQANATSSEDVKSDLPSVLTLAQNYPNPFNPSTSISFGLPQSGKVSLTIMNVLGQTVATVTNGIMQAGNHTVNFDASKLASGIYLYRLQLGDKVQIRKMTLLK